jgi:hypothetical protein
MSDRKVKGPQGQQELYDFDDGEIKDAVVKLVEELKNKNITVKDTKFWI